MRIAIVGSRGATVTEEELERVLPAGVTEIVSGGAQGIDTCAARFAAARGIRLTIFRPAYDRYGRAAPLRRNEQIVTYADEVIAFWDGQSRGTAHALACVRREGKPLRIFPVLTNKKTTR